MSFEAKWIFKEDDLAIRTKDINAEKLFQNRCTFIDFIRQLGKKADLPSWVIATAAVFFHRFFTIHSYSDYDPYLVCLGALFLGAKCEDTPKKISHHKIDLKSVSADEGRKLGCFEESQEYIDLRHMAVAHERKLLQTLDFDLSVNHAYNIILKFAESLNGTVEKGAVRKIIQTAWSFYNDSLMTDICLRFASRNIANACLFLGVKMTGVEIPPVALDGLQDEGVLVVANTMLKLLEPIKAWNEESHPCPRLQPTSKPYSTLSSPKPTTTPVPSPPTSDRPSPFLESLPPTLPPPPSVPTSTRANAQTPTSIRISTPTPTHHIPPPVSTPTNTLPPPITLTSNMLTPGVIPAPSPMHQYLPMASSPTGRLPPAPAPLPVQQPQYYPPLQPQQPFAPPMQFMPPQPQQTHLQHASFGAPPQAALPQNPYAPPPHMNQFQPPPPPRRPSNQSGVFLRQLVTALQHDDVRMAFAKHVALNSPPNGFLRDPKLQNAVPFLRMDLVKMDLKRIIPPEYLSDPGATLWQMARHTHTRTINDLNQLMAA